MGYGKLLLFFTLLFQLTACSGEQVTEKDADNNPPPSSKPTSKKTDFVQTAKLDDPDSVIAFEDENLEAAIVDHLNDIDIPTETGKVTTAQCQKLTELKIVNSKATGGWGVANYYDDIASLEGIQFCTELSKFKFYHHKTIFPDLSPLCTLPKLQTLDLQFHDNVEDLNTLAACKNLITLTLNEVNSKIPLNWANLSGINILNFFNEKLDLDITSFLPLTKLTNINLQTHSVYNLNQFSNLPKLTSIALRVEQVDVTTFPNLPKLTDLTFSSNSINDLGFLKKFPQMSYLSLEEMNLAALSSLPTLANVSALKLQLNEIEDVSWLAGKLTKVNTLILTLNPVKNAWKLYSMLKKGDTLYIDHDAMCYANNGKKDCATYYNINKTSFTSKGIIVTE